MILISSQLKDSTLITHFKSFLNHEFDFGFRSS